MESRVNSWHFDGFKMCIHPLVVEIFKFKKVGAFGQKLLNNTNFWTLTLKGYRIALTLRCAFVPPKAHQLQNGIFQSFLEINTHLGYEMISTFNFVFIKKFFEIVCLFPTNINTKTYLSIDQKNGENSQNLIKIL